jgi:protein-tyrosine kinase
MSRIHEALKKAQEERAAQQSERDPAAQESAAEVSTSSSPASSSAQVSAPISAPVSSPAPSAVLVAPDLPVVTRASQNGGPLTFESLLAHSRQRNWKPDPAMLLFANGDGDDSMGKEVFRTLRARLYQIRAVQPLRTVLITSALPGEGKTFVASNLAQSLVRQRERRTLLIDADLRQSNLHLPMGAESSPGLSDYLLGDLDEYGVLQRGSAENLFMISGGKASTNPTELLANGRFEVLLERLSPIFDWILIDSPPTIPVSDSTIISKMCDGVLMVVRAGMTPFDLAQKACEAFKDRPLLGAVLNRTDPKEGYGGYYNQGYPSDAQKTAQ